MLFPLANKAADLEAKKASLSLHGAFHTPTASQNANLSPPIVPTTRLFLADEGTESAFIDFQPA